jgi:hypothetical protein
MDKWPAFVNTVMDLLVPQKVRNFSTNWETVSFSRRTLVVWSKLGMLHVLNCTLVATQFFRFPCNGIGRNIMKFIPEARNVCVIYSAESLYWNCVLYHITPRNYVCAWEWTLLGLQRFKKKPRTSWASIGNKLENEKEVGLHGSFTLTVVYMLWHPVQDHNL